MGSCVSRDNENGKQPFRKAAERNRERRERHEQRVEALYRRNAWEDLELPSPSCLLEDGAQSASLLSFEPSPSASILLSSEPSTPKRGPPSGTVVFVTRTSSLDASPSLPLTPTSDDQRTFVAGVLPPGDSHHQTDDDECAACQLLPHMAEETQPKNDSDAAGDEEHGNDGVDKTPPIAGSVFESSLRGMAPSLSAENLLEFFSASQNQPPNSLSLLPLNEHETRPWRFKLARRSTTPKFHNTWSPPPSGSQISPPPSPAPRQFTTN